MVLFVYVAVAQKRGIAKVGQIDPRYRVKTRCYRVATLSQLIMAAVTTDICLVFPAISAVEAGFEVQAVLDASGSSFEIGEEMSRRRMERAGVWLTSTNTMVAELV
jgi:hypothetical protein